MSHNLRSPNRCSVVFKEAATRNAERIELFTNSREGEEVLAVFDTAYDARYLLKLLLISLSAQVNGEGGQRLFLTSEYIRQVTFSPGPLGGSGVPRQVGFV